MKRKKYLWEYHLKTRDQNYILCENIQRGTTPTSKFRGQYCLKIYVGVNREGNNIV